VINKKRKPAFQGQPSILQSVIYLVYQPMKSSHWEAFAQASSLKILLDRGGYVHLHDRVAPGSFSQGDGFNYDGFEHGVKVFDDLLCAAGLLVGGLGL